MLIGDDPDQVPTNADLGKLAFLDYLGLQDLGYSIPTIASAAAISPAAAIVFISGTAAISTIVSPFKNGGQITLIPTGAFTTTTTGNIALASTAVVNKAIIMTYDGTSNKWYPNV
jgi:hypothetical protein